MDKKWIPKINDTVYFINVYAPLGYMPCWYKSDMKLALDRNMIFKTKEEARRRVEELGWAGK